MAFFEDEEVEDLANVEVDPFSIPVGKDVPTYVEKSEIIKDKNNEPVWVVTWREALAGPNGKPSNRRHSEWLRHPKFVTEETKKQWRRQKIKQVLVPLGVNPRELNQVEPEDVLGVQGTLRLYEKNGYKQFGRFRKTADSAADEVMQGEPALSIPSDSGYSDYDLG
jgi:hypothetical protein